MNTPSSVLNDRQTTPFVGLAPFLRLSIAGSDLQAVAQTLLTKLEQLPDEAQLWMNLSLAMFSLGQRDLGLTMQAQALALQRVYYLAATQSPVKVRLLLLLTPGDLAANTPIDCLLENTDIEQIFYYVTPGNQPLQAAIPEHDVLMLAISEDDAFRESLDALSEALRHWPKPIVNYPQHIRSTERQLASQLLSDVPGLLMPSTMRVSRDDLQRVAADKSLLSDLFATDFPIILRPVGSHAGHDLAKIEAPAAIDAYLSQVADEVFFLAPFIDYSDQDGLFRKFRIALIAGQAFACHMAVSAHWMIHYVNAGMYEDADKRQQEAGFMANFADFAQRHQHALQTIYQRSQLDYVCVDCAQTQTGELLIFEIDHAMVVHGMDPIEMFPYKQAHILKVEQAFRDFLLQLIEKNNELEHR